MAIMPVPVPISSAKPLDGISAHAPNSTASVPTFMAHLFCFTINCLKTNDCPDIHVGSSFLQGQKCFSKYMENYLRNKGLSPIKASNWYKDISSFRVKLIPSAMSCYFHYFCMPR